MSSDLFGGLVREILELQKAGYFFTVYAATKVGLQQTGVEEFSDEQPMIAITYGHDVQLDPSLPLAQQGTTEVFFNKDGVVVDGP
jgi:hypothetical protein